MFTAATPFTLTTVSVQTCTGAGGKGPVYAAAVSREVLASDTRKLVRNNAGAEVVSETTTIDDPDQAGLYAADSLVTVNGRTATVILTKLAVIGHPDVDHLRVLLT